MRCLFAILALAVAPAVTAVATEVSIAAASNFTFVMEPLTTAFQREHPGVAVRHAQAASGNLVAQIRHGAPFDVFLSADPTYPQALITSGHAIADTLTVFIAGSLELWPPVPGDPDNWPQYLQSTGVRRIAIANPDTAPYGRAARDALQAAGIWDVVQSKLVFGENVAQTLQFVQSGHADHGFIAGSLIATAQDRAPANGMPHQHPIAGVDLPHAAVLLRRADGNPSARAFLAWLAGSSAREILLHHGYLPPPQTKRTLDAPPATGQP